MDIVKGLCSVVLKDIVKGYVKGYCSIVLKDLLKDMLKDIVV